MRNQLAVLGLAAMLGVLPVLTTTSAAPAPKRPKRPEIYALIYVGLGKNDPDNPKRIADALQALPNEAHGAFSDPKVEALPIVQDKEKKLGGRGLIEWAESKFRAAQLEGTAVVRVWFTDGSPQEQVIIANAYARKYVKNQQEINRGRLESLVEEKRIYRQNSGPLTKENERVFRRREEAIKHLPHVIEWASLPDKP